jgi:hypothetical protein
LERARSPGYARTSPSTAIAQGQRMQIDLQQPLVVDSIHTDVADFKDGISP